MSFHYEGDRLMVEELPLVQIAEDFGTPCYVYSRAQLTKNYQAYVSGFGARRHRICYAVKANGNIALLDVLARLGSSFDIVSGGELDRVCAAGGDPKTVTFAGVGKSAVELRQALSADIHCFNVESFDELILLNDIANGLGKKAPIAVRINPDVDAKTHPYISTGLSDNKFGIPIDDAFEVYRRAQDLSGVSIEGVACHIGSQLTSIEPIVDAADRVMHFVERLRDNGIELEHIDIGGGLGISYGTESPPAIEAYVRAICAKIPERYSIVIEPGRSIIGDAGALLTQVQIVKRTASKIFAICDASMTELIRPALYQAAHPVLPIKRGGALETVELVGPVCETADFLARARQLPVTNGSLLAVMDCGAYGAVMASNYNGRPRPAEVLVDGAATILARARETVAQTMVGENRLPQA